MARLVRKEFLKTHFQAFRGGLRRLSESVKAQLRGTCCEADLELRKDILPARMRFDNGLAHENPKGANQKWNSQRDAQKRDVVKHLNDYQANATIGVLALPSYSLITALAVSVSGLPAGLTFKLSSRNGTLEGVTGTLHAVTISGDGCDPARDYDKTDNAGLASVIVSALSNGELQKDYIFVPDAPIFQAQADEIQIEIEAFATSGKVGPNDFDVTVAANYEVVVRSEV